MHEVRRDNLLSCLVEAQGGFCSCVVFVAAISFAEAHLEYNEDIS